MSLKNASNGTKKRYWVGILYPENMVEDWQDKIGDIIELPYAYCIHDKDLDKDNDDRKIHVHLMIVFPNTTTYNNALSVFQLLSAPGKKALSAIKVVISVRGSYNYLIHDTESCRKDGKYLYDVSDRICGNNFDIGSYEQIGIAEKNEIFLELGKVIIDNSFSNYADFYEYVVSSFDDINYVEIMRSYSSHFERLLKGNFHRIYRHGGGTTMENTMENTMEKLDVFCHFCGSSSVVKWGKMPDNRQRFRCRLCGRRFV